MTRHNTYYVRYKMYEHAEVKGTQVGASNKAEAYDIAVFESIPANNEGKHPYSAWVSSVTYNNGNWKTFNTHEGKPY